MRVCLIVYLLIAATHSEVGRVVDKAPRPTKACTTAQTGRASLTSREPANLPCRSERQVEVVPGHIFRAVSGNRGTFRFEGWHFIRYPLKYL